MSLELVTSSWLRSSCIADWFDTLDERTKKNYELTLRDFFLWHGKSPQEILNLAKQNNEGVQKLFLKYVNSRRATLQTKKTWFRVLITFLHTNSVKTDPIRLNITNLIEPAGSKLTVPAVRNIFNYKDLPILYKSAFTFKFFGLLALKELDHTNRNQWQEIKHQLDEGTTPIKVTMPAGRRETRNKRPRYFTLVGGYAIDFLREYIETRKEISPKGPIWISRKGNPISISQLQHAWLHYATKANPDLVADYETRSTGFGIHRLRRVAGTLWRSSGADIAAREWMMGHVIDPMAARGRLPQDVYDDIMLVQDWVVKEYRIAEPVLNTIITG